MSDDRRLVDVVFRMPITFTYSDARAAGMSKRRLYELRDHGAIQSVGHGLYQRTDEVAEGDPDLLAVAHRARRATMCLTSALAHHGLTDEIPATIDIALPRGQRHPATSLPITWHSFAADTFDLGRDELRLSGDTTIGVYSPERCIVDAFRLRHQEGREVAVEALRRWLRTARGRPARLTPIARAFPKAEPALRAALEILR